jgi:hypothetical protein
MNVVNHQILKDDRKDLREEKLVMMVYSNYDALILKIS